MQLNRVHELAATNRLLARESNSQLSYNREIVDWRLDAGGMN